MIDTPRTDAHSLDMETEDFDVELAKTYELAWQLERELNELRQALTGRTVSCSNCNALAAENEAMRATMQIIYDACDTCADGAPDASDHDKLCLELTHTLQPYLK